MKQLTIFLGLTILLFSLLTSSAETEHRTFEKQIFHLNKNKDIYYQSTNDSVSNWLDQFDIDGDKINDHIYFNYSGGGHCCYKINIILSSDNKERKLPFEMDGGYISGVDNSQPDQFDIRDIDNDGLPEILMRIQTYNDETDLIPTKWTTDFRIKTNYIVIEYNKGQLITRDFK
jgi:hypothetical protein